MRTIAVTINKGGVGKTTIAKHLATSAAMTGLNVLILDMDTQENAANWGRRRGQRDHAPALPVVQFVTENGLGDALERARVAGCDLVVIDTPPGRSAEAPAAIEASDLILIPFWLESDAFDGLKRTAALARRQGIPAFGILNFATPNSRSHVDAARNVLDALAVPMAPVVLHRYEAYRLANPPGLTVMESEPDSRAAAEVNWLWQWVCEQVQLGTGAIVHNGVAA